MESLIEHPAQMTHLSAADSPLAVDPGLVRCSVGIETVDDLVDDLRQALDAVQARARWPPDGVPRSSVAAARGIRGKSHANGVTSPDAALKGPPSCTIQICRGGGYGCLGAGPWDVGLTGRG